MRWRQFILNLQGLDAEQVEAVFAGHHALAITYSDAADDPVLEPLPGETPLWQHTCITGLFDASFDAAALAADLRRTLSLEALPPSRVEVLEDRAWEREWLKDFRPLRFGRRLWVCPTHAEPEAADAICVRLDPGLAFGTGTHPTTALCLEFLDRTDVSEKRVLDFGCGSGILVVAAVMLGASRAMGYDIDPQAVTATRSNAAANGVAARLAATAVLDEVGQGYDLVLANILAKPLYELAEDIVMRLNAGGSLVLSGLLLSQCDALCERYREWVSFEPPAGKHGWACLVGQKR